MDGFTDMFCCARCAHWFVRTPQYTHTIVEDGGQPTVHISTVCHLCYITITGQEFYLPMKEFDAPMHDWLKEGF